MVFLLFLLPIVIFAVIFGRNPRAETPVAWFVVYFTAFLIAGLFLGLVFGPPMHPDAWKWGLWGAAIAITIRWGLFGWLVRITTHVPPSRHSTPSGDDR